MQKPQTLELNHFRARKAFPSGVIEGLNNKAKVNLRKAYGFRTFAMVEIALYIMHLANYLNLNSPTISTDEPISLLIFS